MPEKPLNVIDGLLPATWVGETLEARQSRSQKEAERKLTAIVSALARGRLRTPGAIRDMAKKLGLTEAAVRRVKWDKRTTEMVRQRVQQMAVYGIAEALPQQVERAKESTQGWKALAQAAQVLDDGGVKVTNNTLIDRRDMGDTNSDRKFFESYHRRIETNARLVDEGETQPN